MSVNGEASSVNISRLFTYQLDYYDGSVDKALDPTVSSDAFNGI